MKVLETHPAAPGVHQNSTNPIPARRKEHNVDGYIPNIVLFGEPGVGKSSIINLIAGQKIAHTSNDALGRTFQHQRYIVTVNGTSCTLLEITGLDEASEGTVPTADMEINLRSLIQRLGRTGGISLVIYCIRANRFTKVLQDKYHRFYVAVCRKKVRIALVVTGLEHQEGEMETWWDENAAVLREYNMRFDAHECVTTLDVEDNLVQTRQLDSQRRLRELVVRYSKLSAWKAEPSFISQILLVLKNTFRGTISAGRARNSTATRRVVTCDMMSDDNHSALAPVKFPSDISTLGKKCTEWTNGQQYEFVQLDKWYLESPHVGATGIGLSAGALVFYTSHLGNTIMQTQEIDMLEAFYEVAGGQTCPVIVVLRGCDDERAIQACRAAIVSRSNIQVYPTPLSDERLVEIIEKLCTGKAKVKLTAHHKVHAATKQWFMTAADKVRSAARTSHRPRQHQP